MNIHCHLKLRPMQSIKSILTKREHDVLFLIAKEYTTPEIARRLFLSTNTVVSHRRNLMRKLGARNSAGMIYKAFKTGELSFALEQHRRKSLFEQIL